MAGISLRPEKRLQRWMIGTLFWIPLLYNTDCWGQIDAIVTFFLTAAALLPGKKMPGLGLAGIHAGINMKLQARGFFSGAGADLHGQSSPGRSWKKSAIWLGITVIIKLIILFPFIRANQLPHIWAVATQSVDFFPVISMNAFNFWFLALDMDLRHTSDQLLFQGIS